MTNRPPFPDVEKALITLFKQWATDLDPAITVVNHIPDQKTVNAAIEAGNTVYVQVKKVSGAPINRVLDHSIMDVSAISNTRERSQQTISHLQNRLSGWYGEVPTTTGHAIITRAEETRTPVKFPDLNPDARKVHATFEVVTRRPRL